MSTNRGGFSSRMGFIAAAAGSAVGLGNIWRFPYETGENGGAAFLVVYLICMIIIGFPVMVGEIAVGRHAQANPYGAYRKLGNKNWGLVGIWGIICGIMFLSAYNVVAGWAFGYFTKVSFGDLLNVGNFGSYFGGYIADISDNFFYSVGFMLITAVIVLGGIKKGIESAAKILMPLLLILLISLIIYSLTLENAMEGVKYYLIPDFSLINFETFYSALGQAFFSLSLGMGALITYGSYINKEENIINAAGLVVLTDTLVAFLAGLLIFPLVFSQGQSPSEGPGLIFVALPGIFAEMGPLTGRIVGGAFFLLLCFAALTSTISLLEIPVSFVIEEKKWKRKKVVILLAAIVFLISIPSLLAHGAIEGLTNLAYYEGKSKSFFDLIFDIFNDVGLPLGGFLLTMFIASRWKIANFHKEITLGNDKYLGSFTQVFLTIMITYVCPIILGTMFVVTVLQKFFGISLF